MRKANQPALIHTLIIPEENRFLLGRNGLILPVSAHAGHFRLDGTLSKDRVVLMRLSFSGDDTVTDGERRAFWLPHPFEIESFFSMHRPNLREGVDFIRYERVGLYCMRTSPKGRLFEAAVEAARQQVASEVGAVNGDRAAA